MTYFLQLLVIGIMIGGIYSLIAMGFTLIYRSTGILNVAQGGFVLFGAYVCYGLATSLGWPFPLAFVGSAIIGAILGVIVELFLLRPMIGQPTLAIVMMTVGLLVVLEGLVVPIWGVDFNTYPQVLPAEPLKWFGLIIFYEHIIGFALSVVLLVALVIVLRFTRIGVFTRAVAEDTQAAEAAGIRVRRIFSFVWAISVMIASVGGVVLGMIMGVYPGLGFIGLKALPVVILGGLESIPGAMVGGVIIGVLEYVCGSYTESYLGLRAFRDVFPFIILVIVLMIRPYGLFGWRRIERI